MDALGHRASFRARCAARQRIGAWVRAGGAGARPPPARSQRHPATASSLRSRALNTVASACHATVSKVSRRSPVSSAARLSFSRGATTCTHPPSQHLLRLRIAVRAPRSVAVPADLVRVPRDVCGDLGPARRRQHRAAGARPCCHHTGTRPGTRRQAIAAWIFSTNAGLGSWTVFLRVHDERCKHGWVRPRTHPTRAWTEVTTTLVERNGRPSRFQAEATSPHTEHRIGGRRPRASSACGSSSG